MMAVESGRAEVGAGREPGTIPQADSRNNSPVTKMIRELTKVEFPMVEEWDIEPHNCPYEGSEDSVSDFREV